MSTYCGKDHATSKCDIVTEISARKSRKNRRCFLCLKPNHIIKFCRTNYKCVKCNGRHHVSICEPYPLKPDKSTEPGVETNQVNKNVFSNTKSSTFLQTARAVATDCENQNSKELRVLFYGCSQKSFIMTTVSEILKLQSIQKERIIIKAFHNKEEAMRLLDVVNICIWDIAKKAYRQIEVYVVPFICNPISGQNIQLAQFQCKHLMNLKLADLNDGESELEVDSLIGTDFFWSVVTNKMITGEYGPVALNTSLGWVLSGKMPGSKEVSTNSLHTTVMSTMIDQEHNLEESIKKFLQLDSIGITNNHEGVDLIECFNETMLFDGKHYIVRLPWKQDVGLLPDNYQVCKRRLKSLLKRLKNNSELLAR